MESSRVAISCGSDVSEDNIAVFLRLNITDGDTAGRLIVATWHNSVTHAPGTLHKSRYWLRSKNKLRHNQLSSFEESSLHVPINKSAKL